MSCSLKSQVYYVFEIQSNADEKTEKKKVKQ